MLEDAWSLFPKRTNVLTAHLISPVMPKSFGGVLFARGETRSWTAAARFGRECSPCGFPPAVCFHCCRLAWLVHALLHGYKSWCVLLALVIFVAWHASFFASTRGTAPGQLGFAPRPAASMSGTCCKRQVRKGAEAGALHSQCAPVIQREFSRTDGRQVGVLFLFFHHGKHRHRSGIFPKAGPLAAVWRRPHRPQPWNRSLHPDWARRLERLRQGKQSALREKAIQHAEGAVTALRLNQVDTIGPYATPCLAWA